MYTCIKLTTVNIYVSIVIHSETSLLQNIAEYVPTWISQVCTYVLYMYCI